MLDVPAPTMLDVPARQSPTLDVPAHLAYNICSNRPPLWTIGCITTGPSNPHDSNLVATVDSGFQQLNLMLDVSAQTMLEALAVFDYIVRSTSSLICNLDFSMGAIWGACHKYWGTVDFEKGQRLLHAGPVESSCSGQYRHRVNML